LIQYTAMTKNDGAVLDYRNVLLSKIKENAISFSIGLTLVTVLLLGGVLYSWSYISSQFKVEKKTQPSVASATNKVRTYTIQEGDQLWLVAQKLYGSGFNMEDIMRANSISNPDLIEVGQKLVIPDVKPKFPTTGEIASGIATSNKVTSNKQPATYVVKEGDNLASIALQVYGDSYAWTKIAEANKLVNPNVLQAGMVLVIPK